MKKTTSKSSGTQNSNTKNVKNSKSCGGKCESKNTKDCG